MDDSLVLAPDGAGGIEARAETGGSGSGALRQVVFAVSTASDTTTADTLQDSSLSATITPTAADSILLVSVDGSCTASRVSGTISGRLMDVALYNSTDAVLMAQQLRGLGLTGTSSASAGVHQGIALRATYTVDSTAARTFKLQFRSQTATDVQAEIRGADTGGVLMTIMEIAP